MGYLDKTKKMKQNEQQTQQQASEEQPVCFQQSQQDDSQISSQTMDEGVQSSADLEIDTAYNISQPLDDTATTHGKSVWNKIDKVADILLWVVIVVLLSLSLLKVFVVSTIVVDGTSMRNPSVIATYGTQATYLSGDEVTVSKLAKPNRGDVAVFYKYPIDSKLRAYFATPAQSKSTGKYALLIKRVVAVEGDTIWVEPFDDRYRLVVQTSDGDIIYENYYTDRNGNAIPQVLMINTKKLANYTIDNKLTIPQGCFFAMGDNREDSLDSRGSDYDSDVTLYTFDRVVGVVVD